MKYNKLTFVTYTETKVTQSQTRIRRRKRADFICECGNICNYDYSDVKTGHTKQCRKCGINIIKQKKTKHNKSKTALYRKWQDAKNRCYNEKVSSYKNYGGRGISMCDDWRKTFDSFYNWCICAGWVHGLQIDRIDVNGNYSPDNCRIIQAEEQAYNKRNTRYVEYDGVKISFAKLLKNLNISDRYHKSIYYLNRGVDINYIIEKYSP